ncbi:MAG: phosphotransferase family protein [Sporichthyaceae bacterium]
MSELRDRLTAFLTHELGQDAREIEVDEPALLGGGSSKTNWAVSARWAAASGEEWAPKTVELILRQEPSAGVVNTGLAQEFALLRVLNGAARAPGVLWLDADARWFERPSLLALRHRGRADRSVLRTRDPLGLGPEGRLALAGELAQLLAWVHAVPRPTVAAVLPDPGADSGRGELRRWERELDELGDHGADLAEVRAWLHAQCPDPARTRLVHGDFRPANALVHDGHISALLDWELAHLGDPCDDLGWYTCSIYRVEHFPEGWGVEEFLGCYVRAGGHLPEPNRLRYWQVLAVFRLAVIALRAARNVELGLAPGPPPPVQRVLDQLRKDIL